MFVTACLFFFILEVVLQRPITIKEKKTDHNFNTRSRRFLSVAEKFLCTSFCDRVYVLPVNYISESGCHE